MTQQNTISTTYQEEADKWVAEKQEVVSEISFAMVMEFAKHLDGFAVLDDRMQLLAMQKAREIDREVLIEFSKLIPKDKVEEIIKNIHSKHIHKHNKPIKEDERPN